LGFGLAFQDKEEIMHARLANGVLPAVLAGTLTLASGGAMAFSELVVFGDSLSDDGNVHRLTQGFPGNPLLPFPPQPMYVGGRQSNGPVAAEYLAQRLGAPLRNFAQAGATTGAFNIWDDGSLGVPAGSLGLSGMQAQVQSFVAQPGPADSNALYMLWGGPNDFVSGLANPASFDPTAAIAAAVSNLSSEAALLYGEGARHFLVPGMADLGISPRARALGLSAVGSGLTLAFNGALDHALDGLRASLVGATVVGYDTFSTSRALQAQFAEGDLSAPEVRLACSAVAACATDPTIWPTYLFWDDLHPTTEAHALLGAAMAAAVPEPQTWALMLIGLALAAWRVRARR
jgi:phospholipase/lecithinase/hemolysin